jgi:hypothetical protein
MLEPDLERFQYARCLEHGGDSSSIVVGTLSRIPGIEMCCQQDHLAAF